MLKDIFPRDHGRYKQSRCGTELDFFARWLVDQGHLRHPLRLHLFRAKQVLDRSDCFRSGSVFREMDLQQAFVVEGQDAYLYLCTGRIFTRFLAATNRLLREEPVDALSLLRRRYLEYLRGVRGFSAQSLKHHDSTVADFFSRGLRPGGGLAGLTVGDVEAYIQTKSKENNRQSLQHVVAHVRAFLRYCGDHCCFAHYPGIDFAVDFGMSGGDFPGLRATPDSSGTASAARAWQRRRVRCRTHMRETHPARESRVRVWGLYGQEDVRDQSGGASSNGSG